MGMHVGGFAAAVVVAAGLGLAAPAGAAVINYNEAVSGDLSNPSVPPTELGALGVGVNAIEGRISCSGDFCADDDSSDIFRVTLAAGLAITDISITVTRFAMSGQITGGAFNAIGSLDVATGSFVQSFTGNLGPTSVFAGSAAGPGDLTLGVGREFALPGDSTLSYNYTVAITAASIPEPATLALFGAALLGLAVTRRRRAAR